MRLQGSPASFACLIDYCMCGLKGVPTYIDVVFCHARTHEENLVILEEICKYGLKLNIRLLTLDT